jgi:predicted RNA polymerase sigma factor
MSSADTRDALDAIYRTEARRVLATLIRLLGGFEAAEEALHEAFVAAVEQWPRDGVPANPCAWLVSTGRFKTVSRWRRQTRLAGALREVVDSPPEPAVSEPIQDDELRLFFTCCHPALAPDARIALTLREVGGDDRGDRPSLSGAWAQIVALYDALRRVDPSAVVALNRAAALSMRDGPEAGLAAIEAVMQEGGLDAYYLAHAARADMQRKLGLTEAARASYGRALVLTRQPAERRFLEARLAQLAAPR